MLLVGFLVSILVFASFFSFSLMLDGDTESPQSAFNISFSISKAPALNETADLTFSFSPKQDISLTDSHMFAAEIFLPPKYGDGFQWVGEKPIWRGNDLKKGETIELNGTIKSVMTGNWTIAAIVFSIENENYTVNWNVNYDGLPNIDLYKSSSVSSVERASRSFIEVHENSASIHNGPFPEYRPESDENYQQVHEVKNGFAVFINSNPLPIIAGVVVLLVIIGSLLYRRKDGGKEDNREKEAK